MNIRGNKRLLGLMLAPFALFTACVGLTPEEQVEYKALQDEVQRIQAEEIAPRQAELKKIIEGNLVVNVEELQKQVNQIRNDKLGPLEYQLEGLKSGDAVLAAPGTKVELEELNRRQDELELLAAGLESQIAEYRGQLEAAKNSVGHQIEEQITDLEVQRDELHAQLEELNHDTDVQAAEITDAIAALHDELEGLDPESEDAAAINADIADLEAQFDEIHEAEAAQTAEIGQQLEAINAQINSLRAELDQKHAALSEQFSGLIHNLEVSLHDVSEEREDIVRRIHELELSTPEELEQTIADLEATIDQIVSTELRPLIERINEATAGGDPNTAARESLRAELEHWLGKLAELRARMNELTSKSFKSLLGGLDLSSLAGLGK